MQFAYYLRAGKTYPKMIELARLAENLGYYGCFLNDHVMGLGADPAEEYLEAWTAMTGIGMQTTKLRVGQIVLFNSLRNPAFLAKSISTLDNMTNGRYELMIGAGWNEPEYSGYDLIEGGRGMPSAKERVDRFEESLKILRAMLDNEITNFKGKFWNLKNAVNSPQPLQKDMKIHVGCKGPRMMSVTADLANGINLTARTVPDILGLIERFRSIVENKGKHLGSYEISGFGGVYIGKDEASAKNLAKTRASQQKISPKEVLRDQLVGTAEQVTMKLEKLQSNGMQKMIVWIGLDDSMTDHPLEYFKDNCISSLV